MEKPRSNIMKKKMKWGGTQLEAAQHLEVNVLVTSVESNDRFCVSASSQAYNTFGNTQDTTTA